MTVDSNYDFHGVHASVCIFPETTTIKHLSRRYILYDDVFQHRNIGIVWIKVTVKV